MQVAPREVLFARGGLSNATQRCLAFPPVPLQMAPVEPHTEFPDAADAAARLDSLVRSCHAVSNAP